MVAKHAQYDYDLHGMCTYYASTFSYTENSRLKPRLVRINHKERGF